jgi:group I intron endonuclease
MFLYLITNTVNGKGYVGMTSTSLAQRFASHRCSALRNPKTPLHCAMAKHGADKFSIRLIGRAPSRSDLASLERAEITRRKTRAPRGYNVTEGGDGQVPGYKPSEATLGRMQASAKSGWARMTPEQRAARGAAISAAKRGQPRKNPEGYVHPSKGCKRSAEFRAKVSAGMKRVIAALPPGEMSRRSRAKAELFIVGGVKEPK